MIDSRKYAHIANWVNSMILICMISMIGGVLFSRALLSSAMIVFVLLTLANKDILLQLKTFITSPVLISISILFMVPLLSGAWSNNTTQWCHILRIKLPLILLPVCFANRQRLSRVDWQRFALAYIIIVAAGTGQSLWLYFENIDITHSAYLQAGTLKTPVGNDHVRFSVLVAVAILTAAFLVFKNRRSNSKSLQIFLIAIIVIFATYLHILAVRTGLLCVYTGLIAATLYLVSAHGFRLKYLLPALGLVVLTGFSYLSFPTFQNRIHYLLYDWALIRQNVAVAGSNDGDRVRSLQAGWQLIVQHPFIGVGFGDISEEVQKTYETQPLQLDKADQILPSSEWILYGAGAGWPGMALCSAALLIPLFARHRYRLCWLLINGFLIMSYIFDIGLEVQFGVFIHAFLILWWHSWCDLSIGLQTPVNKLIN